MKCMLANGNQDKIRKMKNLQHFIVLEGDFRKTATKPVEHCSRLSVSRRTVNDAFHFSINATNIQTQIQDCVYMYIEVLMNMRMQ